jgi:hypothetical protein
MARKRREPGSADRPAPPREEQPPDEFRGRGTPDVPDVRAKNSGHRKKTADKWNQ